MARPLFCELLSATPTVLENTTSPPRRSPPSSWSCRRRWPGRSHFWPYLGEWNGAQTGVFLGELHATVTHTWALANPSPALSAAYATCAAIQGMKRVVREALATLLVGLKYRRPRLDGGETGSQDESGHGRRWRTATGGSSANTRLRQRGSKPRFSFEACLEPRVGERYHLEFFEDRSTLLQQHSPNARAAGRLN